MSGMSRMPRRFAPLTAGAMVVMLATFSTVSPASAVPVTIIAHSGERATPTCSISVKGENNSVERVDVLTIRSTDRAGVTQQFAFGASLTSKFSLLPLSIAPSGHASFPAIASAACLGDVQYTVHLRKGKVTRDVTFPSAGVYTTNRSFDMGDASKYF